jgi:hypothetical protein
MASIKLFALGDAQRLITGDALMAALTNIMLLAMRMPARAIKYVFAQRVVCSAG